MRGFVVLPNAHWHYSYRNLPADLAAVTQSRDALGVSGAAMAVRTRWFLDGRIRRVVRQRVRRRRPLHARPRSRANHCVRCPVSGSHTTKARRPGRYDREMQNERRFYARWSTRSKDSPRRAAETGAIAIEARSGSPFSAAALEDLETALRSFGHPVVRDGIRPWQRVDRRFRRDAAFRWFTEAVPGVTLELSDREMRTFASAVRSISACRGSRARRRSA